MFCVYPMLNGLELSLKSYFLLFSKAHDRIMQNVKDFKSSSSRKLFNNLRDVSNSLVENGGVVTPHPLGF